MIGGGGASSCGAPHTLTARGQALIRRLRHETVAARAKEAFMDSHPSVRAAGATLVILSLATMGCADVLPTAGDSDAIHVAAAPFQMRSYYIAADNVDWDFAAHQAVNPIS